MKALNIIESESVAAVIILYYPEAKHTKNIIDALIQQTDFIVLVDNTPEKDTTLDLNIFFSKENEAQIFYLSQNENLGLGKAQNIGISKAKELDCSHVLICDQDSIPKANMVKALLNAEKNALADGIKVGAVGPRYHNPIDSSLSGFVTFNRFHFSRVTCNKNDTYIPCAFVIASGCLIQMSCLEHVGNMDETFFIDHVDTDWCLRAHFLGYQIIGSCNAVMQHDLGEARVEMNLFGRRRQISVHQPYRQYYVLRNSILLYQRNYTSWRWIGGDLSRLLYRFVFFSLFEGDRWQNFKMMLKGIRDGLFRRTGKLQ